jgi:hypothetical protein
MSCAVKEIYDKLQGEGANAGRPTVEICHEYRHVGTRSSSHGEQATGDRTSDDANSTDDGNVRKLLDKLEIAENLAVNTRGAASGVAKAVEYKGFVNLAGTAPEPVDLGFADPAAGNFALRPDARLRKELPAFEAIPVESIGLYQGEYRHRLPAR